ncbi:MAG: hypothetical protein ACREU4_09220, partial [Burkholderiales bacterium]
LALTGLSREDLFMVVEALGYVRDGDDRFARKAGRRARGARQKPRREPAASPFAALREIRRSG